LITPDRKVLECDATFVAIPAHDGEIGFLAHRAALLCKLAPGELRVETGVTTQHYFVDGGFAEALHNSLIVLTPYAEPTVDIKLDMAEEELAEALHLPIIDFESHELREKAVTRARARRRLARTSH